jgi:hypothetical protein
MFHLPEDSHVLFPEDRMQFSQRIIYHFPEDSAFFPEDRMCFSQRINVHFPEDRLCHFPKTYFIIFKEKSKKINIIPFTDHNLHTQLLKRTTKK